jgi:cytochrome c553
MWPLSSGAPSRRFARARRLSLIAVIAAVEFAASGQAAPTIAPAASDRQGHPPAGLPPQCLLCHESDLITQQKLSRAAWSRELDKMIRWGAIVAPDERERMLDALATMFAPARITSLEPSAQRTDEAPEVFVRSCLSCHERDLIAQQRLARAGWVREVDKMIGWGAPVSETEKTVLVNYLAGQDPVR